MKLTKEQKEHPFFCYKIKGRKTAWDTPEYLNEQDWESCRKFINFQAGQELLIWILSGAAEIEDFFNRCLGWPEGYVYCMNSETMCTTALAGKHGETTVKQLLATALESRRSL